MKFAEKRCKVAFVGAGYMASEHLKAFRSIVDVELVGIFSRTAGRAAKLAHEFGVQMLCSSIADLYGRTKAHLVVISVPELSVREVCLEAFKYPWVCLIEKPAGYDLADAEIIAEAAKTLQRRAFVALNRRHYGSTRVTLEDLALTDQHRLIHVYDQEDQITARKMGRPEPVVENWMYANSIHLIDYFRIFGRGEVLCVEPIIRWNPNLPGFVAAKVVFSSGDIGLYEAVWNCPGPWAVTVTTQQRRWELRPLEQASVQESGSRTLVMLPSHRWDGEFKPGLRLQAEETIKAVKGLSHSLPSLAEGLETMRLVKAIYEI